MGNPLAVVLDGSGLDDAAMIGFAQWTNLSETTFLLPPTDAAADYRVRIFTPGGELPFAGHPTLGSCHAWLEAGGQPQQPGRVVQQCAKGLISITRGAASGQFATDRLAFAAPALLRSAPSPLLLAQVASALGITAARIRAAQTLDNGPVWVSLLLDSVQTVLQLTPDHAALIRLNAMVGVAATYPLAEPPAPGPALLISRHNREAAAFQPRGAAPHSQRAAPPAADLEVRAFAPADGINEDPVTGSLNASLAQWLMADGLMPEHYTASQGVCLGRAGVASLARDAAGQVWVGGDVVTCITGQVML